MITEEEGGGVGIFVIFHMVLFLTEGSIFPLKIVTPAPAILLHGGSLIYTCVCVCVYRTAGKTDFDLPLVDR